MKTLYVKKTSPMELHSNGWPLNWSHMGAYIRCNKKGEVNWDKAPVYKADTLITRNNVIIIKY